MVRPYSVALQTEDGLPAPERIAAEVRFISALEQALGDPEEIVETYQAWVLASESQASDIDAASAALAVRWPRAYQVAAHAGLTGIFGIQDARFEVKLLARA